MRISRNSPGIRAAAGLAALATFAVLAAPARALVIITVVDPGNPAVDGDWYISPIEVPADTNVELFKSTYIKSQPWEGSQATAGKFASALKGQLGFPNQDPRNPQQRYGPFFAYSEDLPAPGPNQASYNAAGALAPSGLAYSAFPLPSTSTYTYATATRVAVPGPVPLLGGLAAFGWSRRLRRRTMLASRP